MLNRQYTALSASSDNRLITGAAVRELIMLSGRGFCLKDKKSIILRDLMQERIEKSNGFQRSNEMYM